jgi:hypothetical protein
VVTVAILVVRVVGILGTQMISVAILVIALMTVEVII